MGIFRGREGEPPGEPRLLMGYAALTHPTDFPHPIPLPGGEGMTGRERIDDGADILSAQNIVAGKMPASQEGRRVTHSHPCRQEAWLPEARFSIRKALLSAPSPIGKGPG